MVIVYMRNSSILSRSPSFPVPLRLFVAGTRFAKGHGATR